MELNVIAIDIAKKVFQLHWVEPDTGSIERMKVIEALESGIVCEGPAGTTTIDPKTHHATLDVHLAECKGQAFNVLETFPQQPPADTQSVCDLSQNPNANQQFVVDVKI